MDRVLKLPITFPEISKREIDTYLWGHGVCEVFNEVKRFAKFYFVATIQ